MMGKRVWKRENRQGTFIHARFSGKAVVRQFDGEDELIILHVI